MKSQRFFSNYECECYGHTFCSCGHNSGESMVFMDNVYDVAETLAYILFIVSYTCDPECECDCKSYECQPEESSDDDEAEAVEEKGEEEEQLFNEPTTSTPCNISGNNLSFTMYGDCRVPMAHVVEEAGQPTTIATVVSHRREASLTTTDLYDVAETLAHILVICGIDQAKAKAAIDVIIYSFIHYYEIRHRIDTVPRKKRLCKDGLIHDLERKCLMNRMEAMLTYSIIKCAFKAFYHDTDEGGIRNPLLEAQLVHSPECLWVHAAKRTAQIFASYEGMFHSAQKNYESLIKCVYKKLYDRMKGRTSPPNISECLCEGCVQRKVVQLPNECNCRKRHVDRVTGVASADCGQGPYECEWVRVDEDGEELKGGKSYHH